jgi:hypothetical protein
VEERITRTQCGKVVFLSQAMRAAQASARLLGVDTTGREQRKRAAEDVARPPSPTARPFCPPHLDDVLVSKSVTRDMPETTYTRDNLRENRDVANEEETLTHLQAELIASLDELLLSGT